MLLKRRVSIKQLIINLIINSAFKKFKEDYKSITKILHRKEITNFQKYFYYDIEYWR